MWINVNLEKITKDDTIVLANNRQVLAFKKTWGAQCGTSALPKALSWQQYLQQTWLALRPNSSKRLISSIESRILIEQSMASLNQDVDSHLLDEVVKNNNYCHAHLIKYEQLSQSHIQSCELFAAWMQHYQKIKSDNHLIDVNDLSELIISRDTEIAQPYIYGFKTLTPEQKLLFNDIGHQTLNAKHLNNTSDHQAFQTSHDEILSAASWAKELHSKHPEQHIAIVSPNLNQDHQQIKSIFDKVFSNTLFETGQKSYNISLGFPLSEYPLIRHIVLILKLCKQLQDNCIETNVFNTVITSPYIAHAQTEQSARALLVNHVLSLSKTHFKIKQLDQYLDNTPELKALIKTTANQKSIKQQTHDKWLLNFNTYLQTWGFATDRALNSSEYQLFNKYQQASLGLNKLAQSKKPVKAYQAIADLKNWLSQIIFQAESAKTPIQILGSLEAEGLYFDAAWILGMTDNFLPAAINSPRFIPSSIAQQHQIPFSSFDLINKDANDTLVNLFNLANTVILSYATTHFENEQRPSPLVTFTGNPISTKYKYQELDIDTFSDDKVIPLSNTRVSGGVGILKDQMACAFKGFSHRLNIDHFDAPHIGLSRTEQGDIVHKILEKIYQTTNSSEALLAYDQSKLDQLIDNTIQHVLNNYQSSGFTKIEHKRLTQLIHQFIATEKQRNAFRVIATEQTIEANVSGLSFNIQLDRVDEMSNGDHIIFDYKTGNLPSNPWCSTPIKEPQLPIYAYTNTADGIAFIKPAPDKTYYIGTAKDQDSLPKKTSKQQSCIDWDEQKQLWQQQLNQASLNYQQGLAEVLPANKDSCLYCDYDSLCRIEK